MTAALPKPSDSAFSRAIAHWKAQTEQGDAAFAAGDPLAAGLEPDRSRFAALAPYGLAVALAIGAGAAAASFATAPALTDSIETVAALDARAVGVGSHIDPSGQQSKAAALNKDVRAMKTEITRLQRALDQARQNQSQASRTAASAAASSQDEVRALKGELASLQKTLDATRDQSAARIEGLSAKLDQSKGDAERLAEVQQRLDRMEKQASQEKAAEVREALAKDARAEEPASTGSVSRDGREPDARAEAKAADQAKAFEQAKPAEQPKVVRNWVVRDVSRGVALLEGRYGLVEVTRGARAPGMGRVRSIERRDGQWVVVTDRGLVLERAEL